MVKNICLNRRRIMALAFVLLFFVAQINIFIAEAISFNSSGFRNTPEDLIVVLVSFSDLPITTSNEYWEQMIFGEGVSSVNDYYKENSNGQFWFNPVKLAGNTTGIYNVDLDKKAPDYTIDDDKGKLDAFAAVVRGLNNQGVDLFSFDKNNDGKILSHELNILFIDGFDYYLGWAGQFVPFSAYGAFQGRPAELKNGIDITFVDEKSGIGTLCHELGHSLRLPDMYWTDNANHKCDTIREFSLMSGGADDCPSHLDPWSKARLGWYAPTDVTYGMTTKLYPATDQSMYNPITLSLNGMSSQYFMVERRKAESFDTLIGKAGTGYADWVMENAGWRVTSSDMVVVWLIDQNVINDRLIRNFINSGDRQGISVVAVVPAGGTVTADEMLCYKSSNLNSAVKTKSGYSLTVSDDFEVTVTYEDQYADMGTVLQGVDRKGENMQGFTIDMATEKISIPDGESITSYMHNASGRWAKFKNNDLSKLLTKNISDFQIAKELSRNTPDVFNSISFGTIGMRPKANTIKVNYALSEGNYVFVKGTTSVLADVEYALTNNAVEWTAFPDEGLPITAQRQTIYIRTPVTVDSNLSSTQAIPASKPIKVTVAANANALRLKPNYKTETLPVKAGQTYQIGDNQPVIVTRDNLVRTGIDISECITNGLEVKVFTTATAKKPASNVQTITFPARPEMSGDITYTTKWNAAKTLEFKSEGASKWGSIPRDLKTGTLVRVKETSTAPSSTVYVVTVNEDKSVALRMVEE